MANEIKSFELEGLSELIKALEELPVQLQDKIIKGFLIKVGRKFIVNELRSTMNYSEKTEKNIRTVTDKNDKLAVFAGVSYKSFWLRFADKGTVERKTKKGYNRGQIIPKNQVRSVVDNQIQPIIDYTNTEFGNEIEKNIQRRLRKIRKV